MQFRMSDKQAETIFSLIDSQIQSKKNWLTTAVEMDEIDTAKKLAKDIRELQDLFAAFNMPAKRMIAERRGIPIDTDILV
jgi:hypothetical protein